MTLIQRRTGGDTALPHDLHPVLRQVFANRDIRDLAELEMGLDGLHGFHYLRDMNKAVALLAKAVTDAWPILVVGDFDADGATSVALALKTLRAMGAVRVDYLVPDRFRFGYGLTPEIVEVAATRAPRLLITVDNGITSVAGVQAARDRGMRVLVTDHHLPGPELPAADAIINPNQGGCDFPSKHLAGVGVIFYTLLALRAALREQGWFGSRPAPNMAEVLDLVALGTVADLVPLDRNNRILVAQGLARIRAGRGCPGIRALLDVGGRDPARTVTSDLGFAAAPRLNAAGRLDDMSVGIECLLTDDPARARELASALDALNHARRELEAGMQADALTALGGLEPDSAGTAVGLCLFEEHWHQGVVGLVASRVKDRYHRPVIALAPADTGSDQLKGSARSIPGFHIRDALAAVDRRDPGLIERFGGHAMAAGLTLHREHLATFAAAFDAEATRQIAPDQLRGVILSDGELQPRHLDLDTANLLRHAAPWGQAFPEPCFDGVFDVLESRVVGEAHRKLVLRPCGGGPSIGAIAFRQADVELGAGPIRVVYRLDVNEYRGTLTPQLVIQAFDGTHEHLST